MKKTRLLALLVLFILAISSVSAAEFSSQKAYNWLASKSVDGSLEDDITATTWSVLAFNNAGLTNKAEKSIDWIFSKQSNDYCFPSSCKTKDTAMALIAMNEMSREDNVTYVEEKLKEMMVGSSLGGMWAIEVSPLSTAISGECTISWFVGDNEEEKVVTVNNGKFPQCQNSYFLDIDRCVKSNLLQNNPGITLTVDCLKVEGAKTITLIYKNDNNFYVLDSQETDKADLIVNNGCYGLAQGDLSCRAEATLYVAWASELIGSDIDNSLYLFEKYEEDNVMHNSLLYLAKKDSVYLEKLKTLQKSDSSFNRNVMDTALAIIALKEDSLTYTEEISLATEWLKTKQKDDGSLGTVTETAAALYAAFTVEDIDIVEPIDETEVECGDDYCDFLAGEDEDICPEDCLFDDEVVSSNEICVVNGICESDLGETYENCADDCYCGDGACDDVEDLEGSCPKDCELGDTQKAVCGDGFCEGSEDEYNCPDDCTLATVDEGGTGIGTIVIILLILLIFGGGGYYAYKKGLFSKSNKPAGPFAKSGYNFRPRSPETPSTMKTAKPVIRPPSMPPSMSRSSFDKKDDELAKSLAEARKLLKK
ncbi:MAG: hypothetical protein KKA65_02845 [Nanoarchaeota archaeon]|nr:hypothetical protein [Nanoarchaeota archaeon]MBU4456415.1 hypothetical protein [Nanoarchaeota archaeon]MCG2720194.1 hypothetical protein [Nanoarchaeota archaeon]